MESLLQGIEENRMDALYLFITDVLRDETAFRRFFANLISLLPCNFSVHRIEVGHEFLKHVETEENHQQLYRVMTDLESLRTLIVSDGYVQRKDSGQIRTKVFLEELPRAKSLVNLDIHRMELSDNDHVELLAEACASLEESLEDVRLTGLMVRNGIENLDPVVDTIIEMEHLRSLTLGLYPGAHGSERRFVKPENLKALCQMTTLQDLILRNMHLDDESCRSISETFETNSFLTSLDLRQNPQITKTGYDHVLHALDRNFSSWCSVMVDDPEYSGRFSVLVELNQADRGDIVRNFGKEKLCSFLGQMSNPSAIWYFLQLHDNVCTPLATYLSFKKKHERLTLERMARKRKAEDGAIEVLGEIA